MSTTAALGQTVGAAMRVVAELTSQMDCGAGELTPPEETNGSGTVIRIVHDTIFAVTASHVVYRQGCSLNRAVTRYQGRSAPVEVISIHPRVDIALVRSILKGNPPPTAPRLPKPVADSSISIPGLDDDRAYVLGCPVSGTCFDTPVQAKVRLSMPPFLRLQTTFIEPGYSGGPVVRRDGAILGIVVATSGEAVQAVRWTEVEAWLAGAGVLYTLLEPLPLPPGKTSIVIGLSSGGRTAREFGGHPLRGYAVLQQDMGKETFWIGALNINDFWDKNCASCAGKVKLLATRGIAIGGGITWRKPVLRYIDETSDAAAIFEFRVGILGSFAETLLQQQIPDSVDVSSGNPITQEFLSNRRLTLGWLGDATLVIGLTRRFSLYLGPRLLGYGNAGNPMVRTGGRLQFLSAVGIRL